MAKFRAFSKVAVSALSTEPNATPTAKPKNQHHEYRSSSFGLECYYFIHVLISFSKLHFMYTFRNIMNGYGNN